ncbi:MAG: DUF3575 domain-containing protein [Bacteroidota bacterium]
MQFNRLIILGFFLMSVVSLSAQQNVLKISPGKLISVRSLSVSAERAIEGHHSAAFGFNAMIPWNALNTADLIGISTSGNSWSLQEANLEGFTLTPEYRYYFQEDAPIGFYGGVFLRYYRYRANGQLNLDINSISDASFASSFRLQGIGGGIEMGYQKVWDNGITIDFNVGIGVAGAGLRLSGDFTNVAQEDIEPAISQINEFLDGIPLVNAQLPNEDRLTINRRIASGVLPIARSNLSIGFAF